MLSRNLIGTSSKSAKRSSRKRFHRAAGVAVGTGACILLAVLLAGWMGACVAQFAVPGREGESTSVAYRRVERRQPNHFPRGTHLPKKNELLASGPNNPKAFVPAREIMRIEDIRVWWESDNRPGPEDDHLINHAMEAPVRRLFNLVSARKALLKVHDTYRPTGVHLDHSLHKEGRAIDLTCEGITMETLAKLCWAAGFDWVYYEAGNKKNGEHIHCSVKAER